MLKTKYIIGLVLISLGLCSCEDEVTNVYEQAYNLKLSRDTLIFGVGGGTKSVEITTNQDWWKVTQEDEATWYSMKDYHDAGGYEMITITTDSCTDLVSRTSRLIINAGDNFTEQLTIIQLGNEPNIYLQQDQVTVDKDTAVVRLDYMSNIDFEIEYDADWLQIELDEEAEQPILRLLIGENKTGAMREVYVALNQVDGDYSRMLHIVQSSDYSEYVPISPSEVKGNKQIPVISGTATSTLAGNDINNAFDGDYLTYFQSDFQEKTNPIEFTFKLDAKTDPLNYIIYYPASKPEVVSLGARVVKVYIRKEGETDFPSSGSMKVFDQNNPTVIKFTPAPERVEEVKFEVISTYAETGAIPSVSCGEVEFYTNSVLYADIFTDLTCSELLPTVTMDKIVGIKDVFYQNIAKHLYNGTYQVERILDLEAIQQDRKNAKVYGASLFEHATGIYLPANEEAVVFCSEFSGVAPKIILVNSAGKRENHELIVGVNKISTSVGGKLYVNNAEAVKVHIANGIVEGKIAIDELSKLAMFEELDFDVVDIMGTNTHIITPVSYAIENQELLLTFESKIGDIIDAAQKFYGVDEGDYAVHSKLGFFLGEDVVEFETLVCLGSNEIAAVLGATGEYNELLFSVMEKIGHAYEPYLNKLWGIEGVSSKLFALSYFYENDGLSIVKENDYYGEALQGIIVHNLAYSEVTNEWLKVVPLWQLYHYLKNALSIDDYYAQLSNMVKEKVSVGSYTTELLNYTNQITADQYDDFFKKWNMGGKELEEPSKLNLAYYVEDNLPIYLQGGDLVPGKFFTNFALLTNFQNILAVEVYNAGFLAHIAIYESGTSFKITWDRYVKGMKAKVIGASGESMEPAYF